LQERGGGTLRPATPPHPMRRREQSERACEPRAERKAEQRLAYYRTTRSTAYVMRHRPRERSTHQGCALGSVAFMILCSAVGSVIAEQKKPANAIRVLDATARAPQHSRLRRNSLSRRASSAISTGARRAEQRGILHPRHKSPSAGKKPPRRNGTADHPQHIRGVEAGGGSFEHPRMEEEYGGQPAAAPQPD
jgi:hypothetical protein